MTRRSDRAQERRRMSASGNRSGGPRGALVAAHAAGSSSSRSRRCSSSGSAPAIPSRIPSALIGRPAPQTDLPPVAGLVRDGEPVPGITAGRLSRTT